jgi:hypothetical protein
MERTALGPEGRGAAAYRLEVRSIYDRDECSSVDIIGSAKYRNSANRGMIHCAPFPGRRTPERRPGSAYGDKLLGGHPIPTPWPAQTDVRKGRYLHPPVSPKRDLTSGRGS